MTDQPEHEPPAEEEPLVGDEPSDIAGEQAAEASEDGEPSDEAGPSNEEAGDQTADPSRLEALERDIERVRQETGVTGEGEEEPAFIQEGEASEDQPVDDTIAPPG